MTTTIIGDNSGNDFSGTIDTDIEWVNPTTNHGADSSFGINKYAAGNHTHALLAFTGLSNIDSGQDVSSATLAVYQESGSSGVSHDVNLYRLLRNWVEGETTWNIYSTGNNWGTAGGLNATDRSATLTAVLVLSVAMDEYKSISSAQLAADVEGFIDGTYSNYGWHLSRDGAGEDSKYKEMDSSEGTDGEMPYLTVVHAAGGKASKNTRAFPLGVRAGMGFGMGG